MKHHETLIQDIENAAKSIAPLWPLTHFVAVNPFLGYADRPIWEASEHLKITNGDYPLPALDWLFNEYQKGAVSTRHLEAAIESADPAIRSAFSERELDCDISTVTRLSQSVGKTEESEFQIGTFSVYLDRREGSRWNHLLKQEAAKACAAHFDQGQAMWNSPWRKETLFTAWRQFAAADRNLSLHGLRGVRSCLSALPEHPLDAIAHTLQQLEVPRGQHAAILERTLLELPGWAGYLRYLDREEELRGGHGDNCLQLLAVLLSYELILYQNSCDDKNRMLGWKRTLMEDPSDTGESALALELSLRILWLSALELSNSERLQNRIKPQQPAAEKRPELQAVFCIDVRSERLRRHLESVMPSAQTIGFAGFFGIPASHHLPGRETPRALCPALLAPPVKTASGSEHFQTEGWISLETEAHQETSEARGWRRFRESAASCFTFVETIGLSYLAKLLKSGFAIKDRNEKKDTVSKPRFVEAFEQKERLDLAEGILRGINLTDNIAPVVLICGHGSQSTNNPYASGLDCGACGGHAGDTNARLAADLLNDSMIRDGLTKRGISIPSDTLFIAGLHNTTTDEVTLFDSDLPSSSDSSQLKRIREALAKAGDLSLLERRATLGVESGDGCQNQIRTRSRDWSQLRPEWGLAGNEAFIVAPRSWTQSSDLKGQAFLHEYAPDSDPEGTRLESILAGPLVVGSWINLQYFASAADNETYGSGQKMIHNVVGGIGVASGNENDLRVGLPWQSVHDGEEFVHRPCRLIACVSAEPHILEKILDKQSHLKNLVTNEWIHLVALGSKGDKWLKRGRDGEWYEKTTTPAHPIEELA